MNLRNFRGDKEDQERLEKLRKEDEEKAKLEEKKMQDSYREDLNVSQFSSHNNSAFDMTRKKIQ